MAKAPATPAATAEKPAGKGRKLIMVIVVGLLVLTVAAAAVVILLLLKKSGGEEVVSAEQAPGAPAAVDLSRPPTFVSLEPFVKNLQPGEGDRYVQVVMALRVSDAKTAEHLKGFMPEIRHRINLVLSGKLPSELLTLDGQQALAAEITDDVNQVLGARPGQTGAQGAPVQSVLFNSLIIQ